MKLANILLFDHFTMLDAFGPAEILAKLPEEYQIRYLSINGSAILGSSNVQVETEKAEFHEKSEVLLFPGGWGTRALVANDDFLRFVVSLCHQANYVLSVCTGSALLAKAGFLDQKEATSNKNAWDWVVSQSPEVRWNREARWTVDGNLYCSSGITAGMDMTLGFIADRHGIETAHAIAKSLEYVWLEDINKDPFHRDKS